jgi:hypothetical protein
MTLAALFYVPTDADGCGVHASALAAAGEVAAGELASAGRLPASVLGPKACWAEQVQPCGPVQSGKRLEFFSFFF